jgi:hypothetical protein
MSNLTRYAPLFALALLALLGGVAISIGQGGGLMTPFMGLALFLFAFLKLANWQGFVKGFKRYDIIAQSIPGYAWAYPLAELALALAYLSNADHTTTNAALLALSVVNLGSVGLALSKGLNVECACMGTALNVPLSTVTVAEYGSMAAMAVFMLLV